MIALEVKDEGSVDEEGVGGHVADSVEDNVSFLVDMRERAVFRWVPSMISMISISMKSSVSICPVLTLLDPVNLLAVSIEGTVKHMVHGDMPCPAFGGERGYRVS